jgi:osmoprotectant transport system permease protein
MVEVVISLVAWFADPFNWQGPNGIPTRVLEHIYYSVLAIILAVAIAQPVGIFIGHTGRGGAVAINFSNAARAVPTFGVILLTFLVAGIGLAPVLVALVVLAIPSMVTNTYAGFRAVDRDVRDSAEGMGMTGWQVIRRVEIPVAMPLIMAGIRISAVQIVATATFAAVVSLGGLGRYIIDGLAQRDLTEVLAGAVLVAALSLLTELGLSRLQRVVVSNGLQEESEEANMETRLEGRTG